MQGRSNIQKLIQYIVLIKLKNRNSRIISTDAEKASDKIQHPFVIKILSKPGIKRNVLNMMNRIYEKLTGNMTINEKD